MWNSSSGLERTRISPAGVDEIVDHLAQEHPVRDLAGQRIEAVGGRLVGQRRSSGRALTSTSCAGRQRLREDAAEQPVPGLDQGDVLGRERLLHLAA